MSGAPSAARSLPKKMWAATAATPFLAAHLQSLQEFPPRQGADTLSMKKATRPWKMDAPNASGN
jgi:hypothetical protein